MEKIKLCYIVSSLANEGPVNVMYNIIHYIDFDKFLVSIVTLIPEKPNTRIKDFKKLPITIEQLAPLKPLNQVSLFLGLKKYIKKNKPQILHAHCPRSLILMSFLHGKLVKSYTAHIYPGIQQKALYGSFKGAIVTKVCNYLMLKTDLPIACSKSVSQQFKEINGWDIKAVTNGCSLPIWQEKIENRNILRRSLGFKEGVKYFIFIGRFSKEKKPDFLIEVFKKINNPLIGLIMLGEGPLYSEFKKYETERIRLEGFKTNVYEYLIASDYYISASDIEGLANTLLESMTVGLPMVLSNIPSHREVIDGMNDKIGLLFDNSSTDDLINKIEEIMTWNIELTTQTIKNYFVETYTAQSMSQAYQWEYLSAIEMKK